MIHLIYISSATSWPTEKELKELLEQARSRNQTLNITGMLLYDNATFVQVLEGEADDVHAVFKSINNDPRNTGVVKLIEKEINKREFPDWTMGFKDLAECQPEELAGYVDIYNGKLDKDAAVANQGMSLNLLMSFSENTATMH